MIDTLPLLKTTAFPSLRRSKLDTLQVNLGYLCNQQCLHCHVDASPRRKEIMDEANIDSVIRFIEKHQIATLDLTGGAPEMNPWFRKLVTAARAQGTHVIDRCNLTITQQEGYEWVAQFLADNQVEIIASLPCYLEENVDAQRGKGVYVDSIAALQQLNALGYGVADSGLQLNLVYNPQGPSLPPEQTQLEQDYKKMLNETAGIQFNSLFTITNMPIKRFGSTLVSRGEFHDYMNLLKSSHLDANLDSVMCRNLISVDWQGYLYDCDFNQMLGLNAGSERMHLNDVLDKDFEGDDIRVMDHCYACTAGQGSSCGGALG